MKQPLVRGPFTKVYTHYYMGKDVYFGLLANHTLYQWTATKANIPMFPSYQGTIVDFITSVFHVCIINLQGQLLCEPVGSMDAGIFPYSWSPQSIAAYEVPLNRSHQLTTSSIGGVCTLIDGTHTASIVHRIVALFYFMIGLFDGDTQVKSHVQVNSSGIVSVVMPRSHG